MTIGLGLGIGRGNGRGTPQIITATVTPAVQSVVDGDTWADLLLASATDTANYASTASGTIASAVAEVNVDSGGWTALSGNEATALTEGESVEVRVTVTDGAATVRPFNAGTVVVSAVPSGLTTFDSNVETFDSNILTFDEAA